MEVLAMERVATAGNGCLVPVTAYPEHYSALQVH